MLGEGQDIVAIAAVIATYRTFLAIDLYKVCLLSVKLYRIKNGMAIDMDKDRDI
jgi:hypothetical protein